MVGTLSVAVTLLMLLISRVKTIDVKSHELHSDFSEFVAVYSINNMYCSVFLNASSFRLSRRSDCVSFRSFLSSSEFTVLPYHLTIDHIRS